MQRRDDEGRALAAPAIFLPAALGAAALGRAAGRRADRAAQEILGLVEHAFELEAHLIRSGSGRLRDSGPR